MIFESGMGPGHGAGRMRDLEIKIRRIVAERLGLDLEDVSPEASFMEDLGADSLDLSELFMLFEEEFDLEIPEADSARIVAVRDAVEYIEESLR